MQHPLTAILQWLDSLRPDHRTTVTKMALMHMTDVRPLHDGYQTTEDNEALVRAWLSPEQAGGFLVASKAIIFRAVVNFSMDNFFSKQGREVTKEMQEGFKQHLLAKGDNEFAAKIQQSNEERPLHDAHWAKAAASWQKLCEVELSDAALHAYRQAHPPALF